jgi:hypothetical protein
MLNAIRAAITLAMAISISQSASAKVKVTIDHNVRMDANASFKFKHVPSPGRDDAGAAAKLTLVVGQRDRGSAELSALIDGILPADEDEPRSNFFFRAGSSGGRIRMDFDKVVDIKQVNSYSWHSDSRAPQIYNLYAAEGTDADFNPSPDERTNPASCGWKLIATVDTTSQYGDEGGQYGVSIAAPAGSLGKFRYLLFDVIETEVDDPYGNTFFSEVDVIAK